MWVWLVGLVILLFVYSIYYSIPSDVLILSENKKDGVALMIFKFLFQPQIHGKIDQMVVDFFRSIPNEGQVNIILDVVDYEFTTMQVIVNTFKSYKGKINVFIPYKTCDCGLLIALCGDVLFVDNQSYISLPQSTILNIPRPLLEQMKLFSAASTMSTPKAEFYKSIIYKSKLCIHPKKIHRIIQDLRPSDKIVQMNTFEGHISVNWSIPPDIFSLSQKFLR